MSSVPYSLADIKLPESPSKPIKLSTQSESDEEHSSNAVNGKGPKSENVATKDLKIETLNEKVDQEPENFKNLKVVKDGLSSEEERARSKGRRHHRKKHSDSDEDKSPAKRSSDTSRSKKDKHKGRRNSSDEPSRSRSPKKSKSRHKDHHSKKKDKKSSKKSSKSTRKWSESSDESDKDENSMKKSFRSKRTKRGESANEEPHSSRMDKVGSKKDSKLRERSDSSNDEISRQDKESSRMEVSEKDRSVSPENRKQARKSSPVNRREKSSSVEKSNRSEHKDKSIELISCEKQKIVKKELSNEESSEKGPRTSQQKQCPKDEEMDLSSSEGGMHKASDMDIHLDKSKVKRYSSDNDLKTEESLSKKSKMIHNDEKVDVQDSQDKPPRSHRKGSCSSSPHRGSRSSQSSERRTDVAGEEKEHNKNSDSSSKRIESPVKRYKISHFEEMDKDRSCGKSPSKRKESSRSYSPDHERSRRSSFSKSPGRRPREAGPEKKHITSSEDVPKKTKSSSEHSRKGNQNSSPSPNHGRRSRSQSLEKRFEEGHRKKDSSRELQKDQDRGSRWSRSKSPEKATESASSKELEKAESSDGELTSSGESSPDRSMDKRRSAVSRSSTLKVLQPEAPKQRLKIKRDNVVVVRKEEEEVDHVEKSRAKDNIIEVHDDQDSKPSEKSIEPGECPEFSPNTNYVPRKITLSNRKRSEKSEEEPSGKKSKWGSVAASHKAKQTVSISSDSLKTWFPDFKLLKEPSVETLPEDPPSPAKEEQDVRVASVERLVEGPESYHHSEPKVVAVSRRLGPLPPEAELKPAPVAMEVEDNVAEPTRILFVRHLVRPFTLLQLKELLGETGRLVDDEFWIDKIKSKCIVTYETVDDAIQTRKLLNGARWPMSNPKILAVSYATEQDLQDHRSGIADQPKPPAHVPHSPPTEEPPLLRRERMARLPMREWDRDKITQDSPERRDEERVVKEKRKEPKRKSDDAPAKLLDDLFHKTKATPCIYWLPLNEQQVKERVEKKRQEQERRNHEREARNQEREVKNQERDAQNNRPCSRQRGRETETRKSSSRSRSPGTRRR